MKQEQKRKRERKTGQGNTALCLIKGLASAFAITCIIFIGFGILLTYTDMAEERIPLISLICTAISAAAAGYDWAHCLQKKGILWGSAAGAAYFMLLYLIISAATGEFTLALSAVMTLLVALAGGAVGGILGVNRK